MKKTCSFILMATTIVGAVIAKGLSPFSMPIQEEPVGSAKTESVPAMQVESEESSADSLSVMVSDKSIPLTFTNDETFPWAIGEGYLQNGNAGSPNSASTLSFSYNCDKRTELSFDWLCNEYSWHKLYLYIDGVLTNSTTNSSFTSARYFIDKGSHVITFKDSIGSYTYALYDRSAIRNICVRSILPLETIALTEKSQPLTFINESEYPWTTEDGYIQNGNYGHQNSTSKFSTTIKIDKPSKFSFWSSSYYYDSNNKAYASNDQYFSFKINGKNYMGREYGSGQTSVLLEPGDYLLEWCDSIYYTTENVKTKIQNIELSSNWVDVELAKAGTLGVEVLYKVDVLNDVELLKVSGNLNSDDWTAIKNMKNLFALDLSEAKFNSVPGYAFDGLSNLSYVVLPEGLTSIEEYAFKGTQILNIDIPNTVTSIGQYAFAGTNVKNVNFKEDSKLTYIGYNAFRECTSLEQFIMPNTVTALGTYYHYNYSNGTYESGTFYGCTNLEKLHFSDALLTLEEDVCSNCTKLKEIHLPQNIQYIGRFAFHGTSSLRKIDLPASLKTISSQAFYQCGLDSVKLPITLSSLGTYAFQECKNLKYVELPSYIGNYYNNFDGCDSIQKIVCKSATPPVISEDPFSNGPYKYYVTLVVPSFAVANYKLDTYWYQFGNIQEMDVDLDYWRIAGALSLTNNRRMNGKPDIDLYYGGQFAISGNAPMTIKNFNLFVSESNPGRLLNDCSSMTADSVTTHFSVDADKWYFLTPLHDVDLTKVTHSNNASFVFRYYDGASRATNGTGSSWRNVDDGKLLAGKGYIFQCNSSGVVTMPSETTGHIQVLNTNDVTTNLEAHESTASANKNWIYVGNPYPAYYDIYYMDFTAPITVWTGNTYRAYSIVDDDFVLRPMQSFFVQKPDAVDNIIFHKEGRQMTSGIERGSAAKVRAMTAANVSRKFFNLEISNEDSLKDDTRLVINEDASIGYEIEKDASKFMSIDADVPQIFTIDAESNNYAINERPQKDGNISVGYLASKEGFYTISAVKAEGEIILFDKEQNKYIDLSLQDYTFYTKSTEGINATRFILMVKANTGEVTGIEDRATSQTRIEGGNGCVNITIGAKADVTINTLNGITIFDGEVATGNNAISLPSGVYIIKVGNTSSKVVVY